MSTNFFRSRIPVNLSLALISNYENCKIPSNNEVSFNYNGFKSFIESLDNNDTLRMEFIYNGNLLDFAITIASDDDKYFILSDNTFTLVPKDTTYSGRKNNYITNLMPVYKTEFLFITVEHVKNYFATIENINSDIQVLSFVFAIVNSNLFSEEKQYDWTGFQEKYLTCNGFLTRLVIAYDSNTLPISDSSGVVFYNADNMCPPDCGGSNPPT